MKTKWEYREVVLRLKTKMAVISEKNLLQGLMQDDSEELNKLGAEGWELVAVIPYMRTGADATAGVAIMKRER